MSFICDLGGLGDASCNVSSGRLMEGGGRRSRDLEGAAAVNTARDSSLSSL